MIMDTVPSLAAGERTAALDRICHDFNVDLLYAFGSRAREALGWMHSEIDMLALGPSDLDIGVKAARGHVLKVWAKVRLADAIEQLFGVTRVDLVCLEDADPFLAANIIRGERLYAVDLRLAYEYDLYILRRAGDLAPLERERLRLIFEGSR